MRVPGFVKDEVTEIFDRIDADADGKLGFEEWSALMREIDHTRSVAKLRAAFTVIDTDHDGHVSFDEFFDWVVR